MRTNEKLQDEEVGHKGRDFSELGQAYEESSRKFREFIRCRLRTYRKIL